MVKADRASLTRRVMQGRSLSWVVPLVSAENVLLAGLTVAVCNVCVALLDETAASRT